MFADAGSDDKTAENITVERDLAEKLLANLPAEDRAILQMLEAEEMSVKEVSGCYGLVKIEG